VQQRCKINYKENETIIHREGRAAEPKYTKEATDC
jgi:hypothetical protein